MIMNDELEVLTAQSAPREEIERAATTAGLWAKAPALRAVPMANPMINL